MIINVGKIYMVEDPLTGMVKYLNSKEAADGYITYLRSIDGELTIKINNTNEEF